VLVLAAWPAVTARSAIAFS